MQRLDERRLRQTAAAQQLGISVRQVYRLDPKLLRAALDLLKGTYPDIWADTRPTRN